MITGGQVLSFILGFLSMVLSLWIYEKKFKKTKKRVFENIGPDVQPKVRVAADIRSYELSKKGTKMLLVIQDEFGERNIYTVMVPDDFPRRFPAGEKVYLHLELDEEK